MFQEKLVIYNCLKWKFYAFLDNVIFDSALMISSTLDSVLGGLYVFKYLTNCMIIILDIFGMLKQL